MIRDHFTPRPDHRRGELSEAEYLQADAEQDFAPRTLALWFAAFGLLAIGVVLWAI